MNSCQICGREFRRKDSLGRHMRMHERGPKARRKSCDRCQRSKIRCSGQRPQCLACAEREVSCVYTAGAEKHRSGDSQSIHKSTPHSGTSLVIDYGKKQPIDGGSTEDTDQEPQSGSVESDTRDLTPLTSFPTENLGSYPTGGTHNVLLADSFIPNYEDTHFDWILRDAGDRMDFNALNFSPDRMLLDHATSPLFWSTYQSYQNTAQEPASKYKEPHAQQEAWLLDPHEPFERSLDIPSLGGQRTDLSKTGSYSQIRHLAEEDRDRIRRSAKACLEEPLWTAVSFSDFPSREKLDHCIDLFFTNFRPVLSFIHKPTFDPTTAPDTLILAIASIGARFTNLTGAASFANVIAKLNRRLLLSTGEREPRVARSESFMTAQLLQGIYGYCSGDKVLFNYSESLRWSLVQTSKQIGLFHDAPRQTSTHNEDAEARWMSWVATERRKRLGWAIYEFDALVSVLHNQRPAFSTGDLTLSLPEDADYWEAPSAYSWIALRPWRADPESIGFRLAARSCFDPSLMDSVRLTDTQHIHIIVVMLARFVWSLKELQVSPLMEVVPDYLPIAQHKMTLTDKMGDFLVSPHAVKYSTTAGDRAFVHVVQRALIIHASYLYAASDLMDWLPALLRSAGLNKPARERMAKWGEEDPARVRKVIYHSSQIIAICRDFPFNTPYESFYVFYAGSVLWCSATLLTSPLGDGIRGGSSENIGSETETDHTILLLDKPSPDNVAIWISEILQWVQEGGGNIQLGMYGVPNLSAAESRVQVLQETVRILQNMRFWDISRAFASTLRRLIRAVEVTNV
ncbi:hypothetical protein Trisim1_000879 [Trichoderma cf. simile WF8]